MLAGQQTGRLVGQPKQNIHLKTVTLPTFSNRNASLVHQINSSIAPIYQELWSSHGLAHCDVTKCTYTFHRFVMPPLVRWGSKSKLSSGAFSDCGDSVFQKRNTSIVSTVPKSSGQAGCWTEGGGGTVEGVVWGSN